MALPTKYNERNISDLLAYIGNGETDSYSCDKIGIHIQTLAKWKKKPEFKERYDRAIENFRKSCPIEIKRKVRLRLLNVLEHGLIQKHKVTTITDKAVYKGEGENKTFDHWLEYKRETVEGETNFGVPQWAFDRILPILPDVEQARHILEKHGYKVIPDPELELLENDIAELKDEKGGITNTQKSLTAEEINLIKQSILFDESDQNPAQHTIDVSAEVDS